MNHLVWLGGRPSDRKLANQIHQILHRFSFLADKLLNSTGIRNQPLGPLRSATIPMKPSNCQKKLLMINADGISTTVLNYCSRQFVQNVTKTKLKLSFFKKSLYGMQTELMGNSRKVAGEPSDE